VKPGLRPDRLFVANDSMAGVGCPARPHPVLDKTSALRVSLDLLYFCPGSRAEDCAFDLSATQDEDDVLCRRAQGDRIHEIVIVVVSSHRFEVAHFVE
jgi:hypothetical protein